MKLEILSVGRIKSTWIREGVDHYRRLLSKYADVTLNQVKEGNNAGRAAAVITQEERRISDRLQPRAFTVVLDEQGRELSSRELADFLDSLQTDYSSMQFVIGGAFGLGKSIKDQADLLLSLSRMTLPHELTIVILLEQLYRAFSISHGSKYHK